MKVEIITIGDEILIGQIVDTNSAWLGAQLNPLGWEVVRITTIPDTIEAITDAVDQGLSRADLVLMTGGLGPTKDDVTKLALCQYYNTELRFDEESYENIKAIFSHFNREISDVNRQQAEIPAVAQALPNRFGTAPGMWFENERGILVSMPGVPYEMKCIMEDGVLPRIASMSDYVFEHKTTVVSGIPESIISERITDIETNLPEGVKVAYLPHYNLVRVRVTGRGYDRDEVWKGINEVTKGIQEILGDAVVTEGDEKIQETVGKLLKDRSQSASFAESCTGGYVAHLVTSVPGSSAYFPGSVVTYSYENKTDVLGVTPDMLWSHGAVSQEVVEKMCTAVRIKNNTDYGVAISGIAGPGGGTTDKPVGTVWMAVCDKDSVYSKVYHLRGDRKQNIERSGHLALELLRKRILGQV